MKNGKLKVAILIDTWFPVIGGGQTHVHYLAKYLKKYCDVEILTSNQKGLIPKEFYPAYKIKKLGPAVSTNHPFRRIMFLIFSFLYLLSHDHDLIHAQAFISGFPAKLASLVKHKPVIYTVHGTGLVNSLIYKGIGGIGKKYLEKILLLKMKYDAQISVSRDFLRLQNNNKVIYIPNGKTQLKTIKFKKIPNTVLYIGRIHPQKGINILLKAVVDAQITVQDLNLTIVGSGELNNLKNTLNKLELNKYVKIRNPIYGKELLKIIKQHSIFVLPSFYEGQPITLLEAMEAKTPIVASNVGDIPFLLKNNNSGLLIKPNDWKGISNAIIKLLTSKKLSQKLTKNAYHIYLKHDNWQNVAYKTYQLYSNLR